MTDQAQHMLPQPTTEHQLLEGHAGRWNVACQFYVEPGKPPMETPATETVEMVGPFWTISKYESNLMGMPFVGRATMGSAPHAQRFVSTWIDSCSPVLFSFTGKQKGDTIEMRGKAWSCMTNSLLMHRTKEKHIGKNERLFEMFCTLPDGTEIKMMTNHYRRA